MGPRIPVRVTPHSSAHPNNTGGGEGGQSRPNGVFRKTGTTKNGKRDEARRGGHVLHLCIERGRGNPEGVRESMGGPHCLFFLVSSFSSKLSHIGVGSFPPLARKGGDGQVPKGQVCGGGLGRSQGIVHITWDGKQSNIRVLLGNSASPIIRKLLCFLPSHRKYFHRLYLPPQECSHSVFWKTGWRVACCVPTYLLGCIGNRRESLPA